LPKFLSFPLDLQPKMDRLLFSVVSSLPPVTSKSFRRMPPTTSPVPQVPFRRFPPDPSSPASQRTRNKGPGFFDIVHFFPPPPVLLMFCPSSFPPRICRPFWVIIFCFFLSAVSYPRLPICFPSLWSSPRSSPTNPGRLGTILPFWSPPPPPLHHCFNHTLLNPCPAAAP